MITNSVLNLRARYGTAGFLTVCLLGLGGVGVAVAQDVRIFEPAVTGDRTVSFSWSLASGDTLTANERQTIPEMTFVVSKLFGVDPAVFPQGVEIMGRGAGGFLGTYRIHVGDPDDFYKVGEEPPPPPPGLFEVTGVFQFGEARIGVAFGDRVNVSEATNATNYTFSPGSISIQSISIQENGKTAILVTATPLPPSTAYTLNVGSITSESGQSLSSSGPFNFQTVAGPVMDIADVHANLSALLDSTISVVGQVFVPTGISGGTASGYIQDGSGRGLNLWGDPVLAAVDDRTNIVEVTGTVVDTTGTVSITAYSASVLAKGQPVLAPRALSIKNAQDPRWKGTFIETGGNMSRIDAESDLDFFQFSAVTIETLFTGYQIWRADSEDPTNFTLLRTYSLLDSTWTLGTSAIRTFCDPDSIILRGTERDIFNVNQLSGPFNGFGYIYSVTWFDAVVNGTVFPPIIDVIQRTTPVDGQISAPVFPGTDARLSVPLVGKARVVPNPYNPAAPFGRQAFPGLPRVQFVNLPRTAQISIYTVAGDLVRVLEKVDDTGTDAMDWDLTNSDGQDIAPGIYIFFVEHLGETASGRFVIAR